MRNDARANINASNRADSLVIWVGPILSKAVLWLQIPTVRCPGYILNTFYSLFWDRFSKLPRLSLNLQSSSLNGSNSWDYTSMGPASLSIFKMTFHLWHLAGPVTGWESERLTKESPYLLSSMSEPLWSLSPPPSMVAHTFNLSTQGAEAFLGF